MPGSDPSNFLNMNFGEPTAPGAQIPNLVKRPRNAVPEVEDLFQAQSNLVKAMEYFHADQDEAGQKFVEHAYRTLRSWLQEHG
jgi:hypothetical protein